MELMDGSINDLIQKSQRQMNRWVRSIAFQCLSALEFIHAHGFCHRDIKNDNILYSISPDGQIVVKLAGFGLCRRLSGPVMTGEVVTEYFRPPEIFAFRGTEHDRYDSKIDLWSLGVVFLELLIGRAVFPAGVSRNTLQCWSTIVDLGEMFPDRRDLAQPMGVREFVSTYNDGAFSHMYLPLVDLVDRMLKADPTHRISAFEALRHECFSSDQSLGGSLRKPEPKFVFSDGPEWVRRPNSKGIRLVTVRETIIRWLYDTTLEQKLQIETFSQSVQYLDIHEQVSRTGRQKPIETNSVCMYPSILYFERSIAHYSLHLGTCTRTFEYRKGNRRMYVRHPPHVGVQDATFTLERANIASE
jgi:serine/threonine protein kinase